MLSISGCSLSGYNRITSKYPSLIRFLLAAVHSKSPSFVFTTRFVIQKQSGNCGKYLQRISFHCSGLQLFLMVLLTPIIISIAEVLPRGFDLSMSYLLINFIHRCLQGLSKRLKSFSPMFCRSGCPYRFLNPYS